MAERTRAAPSKSYEVHDRSVRVSDKEARRQARPYLADLYTNSADKMICQACHQEMPFRLADGSPYFEAPELLADASSEAGREPSCPVPDMFREVALCQGNDRRGAT